MALRFPRSPVCRTIALCSLFGAISLPSAPVALAAQTPASFDDEATVVAVEVPVRVLRRGLPVRGLTAENFVVYDEGRERPILGFEMLDLEAPASSGPDAGTASVPGDVPIAARRHFLLLFDLDFTDAEYLGRAYRAARWMVEEELRPSDLVAVAFYSQRAGVSSVLGFTPDHAQALTALHGLGRYLGEDVPDVPGSGSEVAGDPLGLTVGDWEAVGADLGAAVERERSLAQEVLDEGLGGGRAGSEDVLVEMARAQAENVRQQRAARASILVDALRRLAEEHRSIEGQKSLVLFSRGFESDLYLSDGGSWLLSELDELVRSFRRAGWNLYGIEGVELNTTNARQRRESLVFLSSETGGTLVSGRDDLGKSMDRVLQQTSVTYLLTFQTSELVPDGSFRELRVELRGAPRGARAHHRAGYYAPRPFVQLGGSERRASSAELVRSGLELDELGAAVFAGPMSLETAGGEGGTVAVPVVIEVGREALLAGPVDRPPGVEVHVYAFDEERRVVATIARQVAVEPDRLVGDGPGGLKFFGDLALAPGSYDLRVLTRSLRTGRATLRRVFLEVPVAAERAALTAVVFAQGPEEDWLLVRGAEPDAGEEERYPFVYGGERYLPAIRGLVRPGVETRLLLVGHGLTEGRITVEARLLDAAGRPLDEPTLDFLDRRQGIEGQPDQVMLAFEPEEIAAGDYHLEIGIGDPEGEWIGTLRAPIRVLPP